MMTHDPDRDKAPADTTDDAEVASDDVETENIKDDGEPMGANLA